jgi:hypothetical protein
MEQDRDPRTEATRQLMDAIERAHADVAKVEFWADVLTGFAQPIPEYRPGDISVWLPGEQATKLGTSEKI